jgi:hypothetical protein
MANGEQQRVVKYKRIVDPSDPHPQNPASYIDVPCITGIWFLSNNGQMYHRTFDSTANNTLRDVTVVAVDHQTQGGGTDTSNSIQFERINQVQVQNSDWYEYLSFKNDPNNPPVKRKSHVLRYNQANQNDANATPWVDVEVMDQFAIQGFLKQTHSFKLGETDSAQVNIYNLNNDPGQALVNDDGSDPLNPPAGNTVGDSSGQTAALWSDNTYWGDIGQLPLDTNGNPDPVRLDPFQNIVNVNWASGLAVEFQSGGA